MRKLTSLFALALLLMVSACSGGSGEKKMDNQSSDANTGTQATQARELHIYGIDKMKFVVKGNPEGVKLGAAEEVNGETYHVIEGITAKPGEEIHVKMTTISKLPASAMSHNWILLKMDADPAAFASASAKAKDSNYIAPDKKDEILHETGLTSGGETHESDFTAPSEKGDYPYLCTFPGHFAAGMKGTLTVE